MEEIRGVKRAATPFERASKAARTASQSEPNIGNGATFVKMKPEAVCSDYSDDTRRYVQAFEKACQEMSAMRRFSPTRLMAIRGLKILTKFEKDRMGPLEYEYMVECPPEHNTLAVWKARPCLCCAKLVCYGGITCVRENCFSKCFRCENDNRKCDPIPQSFLDNFGRIQQLLRSGELERAQELRKQWVNAVEAWSRLQEVSLQPNMNSSAEKKHPALEICKRLEFVAWKMHNLMKSVDRNTNVFRQAFNKEPGAPLEEEKKHDVEDHDEDMLIG